MKAAYADPPYFGCGQRLYGDLHPEAAVWDSKESHIALVGRLMDDFPEAWALSCNPADLKWLLPECPPATRVCPWVKTWHRIRPNVSVQYAWEPLLVYGGRTVKGRHPLVRDWVSCSVTMKRTVKGAKPDEFCWWMFRLLGLQPDDDFHDLFPGSGAVSAAWDAYCRQGVLL